MNIHPLFVHFPIALLTIYCAMEMMRFKKIATQPYWFFVKAMFVIFGTVSGFAALFTGGLIEDQFKTAGARNLIEMHSLWATITMVIFSVIAACYLIEWVERSHVVERYAQEQWYTIWKFLIRIKAIFFFTPVIILASVVGLVSITITGALGGALAYGADVDPIVHFVYGIFVR